MLRDVVGGFRSVGRAAVGEGRAILGELDAPTTPTAGRVRRVWRFFRRAPVLLQAVVGLVFLGLWTWFVVSVYT
jgi:hypothetical protein